MEVTIHYNGQAVTVEVTLEVYEYLDRADHKAENLSHEQRRHWDGREFDEYIVATEGCRYLRRNAGGLPLPHGNAGRADGRPGHLHRDPAPPVPALCPGRFELRGDWNDLRLLKVFCPGLHYRGQKKIFKDFLKTDPTNDPFSGYQVKGIVSLIPAGGGQRTSCPPLPFSGGKPMKTINLRWMYPHYRHDEFVEVSDEVWEAMRQAQREMNNYERRKVYHRAWYSLDAYSWTENYALEHGRSPEDILVGA